MAGKVTADEYKKVVDKVNSTYTQDSLNAYRTAYNDAMKSWKSSNEAYASASWLLKKIDSWSSSNSNATTSGWTSGWTTWSSKSGDIYGDVSGVSQNVWAKDYSSYNKQELGDLSKFWESAKAMERASSGSISKRNDIIAWNLYTDKKYSEKDVRDYLWQQAWFNEADERDRENTVRAITERLKQMQEEAEGKSELSGKTGLEWEAEWKAGYYKTKDGWQKIYGYDEMDAETQKLLDRMDDSQKKYVSNMWASGMQEDLKYYLDTMRAKDQAGDRQKINQDLYDINRESSIIQAEQTIRNAEESYNNLKQNWQYLGNLWMPWVSSTKLQAIGDAITEAKTQLWEIKRLTQLSLDAQEKQWEWEVLKYNQQIDNLMYNLKWQVWDEITNALSKYTTAELEWKLDTIDGITAFRKELLDDLDNNLSGLTSASLTQMQWINQQYQDIANKMYDYVQNANTVNTEMSAVKGYYVDGNGNAILNDQWQPIQVPQNAPIDPIFDKETGRLITFGLDENWNIVASVQQVYQGDGNALQSTIVSLLEQWASVQDILKYVPWVDLDTVQKLAQIVKPLAWDGYADYTWQGKNYNAVDRDIAKKALSQMAVSGTGWWCGSYVNQYLQKMGFPASFIQDSLESKLKIINTDTPQVWDVVVFDYNHITPETWVNNGHVWIVRGFRNGKMIVQDSNFDSDRKIKLREVSMDSSSIQGYFDPTISIDEYNTGVRQAQYKSEGLNEHWFNNTMTGYYDKFLAGKFTTEDTKTYYNTKFEQELENYKKFKESQVADATVNMLRALYNLQNMNAIDYNAAWLKIPKTDGYTKRRSYENYISNTTLNKLIESKKSGATFGALSDAELWILTDAATILDFKMSRSDFNSEVNRLINEMEQWLRDVGRSDLIVEGKQKVDGTSGWRETVSWWNL